MIGYGDLSREVPLALIGSYCWNLSQSQTVRALSREPHLMSDTSMDDSSSYQDIDGLSFLSSLLGATLAPDLAPVLLLFLTFG